MSKDTLSKAQGAVISRDQKKLQKNLTPQATLVPPSLVL
jgi:hypothetical protein